MLKKIRIYNFKTINDLTIEFTPFTVLIGENSCGKSTVLQAIDLLSSLVQRDIDEYLKDKGWTFIDIKSQFTRKDDPISFVADFVTNNYHLEWSVSINYLLDSWIIEEDLSDIKNKKSGLYNDMFFRDFADSTIKPELKSSVMKLFNFQAVTHRERYEPIRELKSELLSINNFELLYPKALKGNSLITADIKRIDSNGDNLPTYISSLHIDVLHDLNKMVSDFVGYDIELDWRSLLRQLPRDNNQVSLYVKEAWGDITTEIDSNYLSDGFLRIIALCTILITSNNTRIILLDEIEDGINPQRSEDLVELIQSLVKKNKYQVIVTSHSPILLSYTDTECITFLWRDKKGSINAKPLFGNDSMKEVLEFLNPGEVWLNYSKDRIVSKLQASTKNVLAPETSESTKGENHD